MLLAIAEAGPSAATATEIGLRAKVKTPNVAVALRPLVIQDLLRLDDRTKTYSFALTLVPIWLRGRELWVQSAPGLAYAPTLKIVEEELERYRQDRSTSWEALARDTASQFDGRTVPGRFFASPVDVTLPSPSGPVRKIEGVDRKGIVFAPNTSVELDVHVPGTAVWLGEVKTTGRVSAADIKRLKDKAAFFEKADGIHADKLWFVSTNSFDTKAKELASKEGVLCTLGRELTTLRKLLKKP